MHKLATLLLTGALIAMSCACQKQEGPAERAGKEIDKSMQKAGKAIEKFGDDIQHAARGENQDKKN